MNALAVVPRETTDVADVARIHSLPIEFVKVGPNVRVNVVRIEELSASIAEHGVLQAIKVRHAEDGASYEVTWGQRRLLASKMAGLTEIPAIIDDTSRTEAELAIEQLVENLAREDLNPLDRARSMRSVVDAGVTQADLARQLGLAPSTVANDLRLLETASAVQELVESGSLTPAHAKAIAGLDVDIQGDFATKAVSSGWSAHETERQAKYAQDSAKQTRERLALEATRLAQALALLEKVANPETATIGVSGYYGGDGVATGLKKAGWTVVDGWKVDSIDNAGECGCNGIWRLGIPYGAHEKVSLNPGCNSEEHKAVRIAARDAKWAEQRAEQERARKKEAELAKTRAARVARFLEAELAKPTPAPLAQRLAIAAITEEVYGDDHILVSFWKGTEEEREALDDETWGILEQISDADLPKVFALAIANSLDDYGVGAGARAAIDAAFPPEPPKTKAKAPAK